MEKNSTPKLNLWRQFLKEIFKTDQDIKKFQEFMDSHLQLKQFIVSLGDKYRSPHEIIVMAENKTDAIIKALNDPEIKKVFGNHIPWFRDAQECCNSLPKVM